MDKNVEIFEDLHDSSLIEINITSDLTTIEIVLSVPFNEYSEKMIIFLCKGVLRFEFETTGDGEQDITGIPIEIYDIYNDKNSKEYERWKDRIQLLNGDPVDPSLYCIIFASSFIRGWGKRDGLEGMNVICRGIELKDAPKKYLGREYKRHRI